MYSWMSWPTIIYNLLCFFGQLSIKIHKVYCLPANAVMQIIVLLFIDCCVVIMKM